MTIFIAIVGLGLLVFVHELGHFVASLALRMRPRKFYIGFPPAVAQAHAQRHRVRHRDDPARGLREDPRHAPARAGRRRSGLRPSGRGGAGARGRRGSAPAGARLPATTMPPATRSAPSPRSRRSSLCRSSAAAEVEKGVADIGDALGPDAYWRARTWKRVLVIFAGPAANIVFAFVLFTGLYMTSGGKPTTTVESVRAGTAAAALGLRPGDRIVSIDGVPMTGDTISRTIAGSNGRPLTRRRRPRRSRASRSGRAPPRRTRGVYRLGFVLRGRGALGACGGAAVGPRHRAGLEGHRRRRSAGSSPATGRKDISSPVGHRPGLVRRREAGHRQLPLGARPDLALDRAAQPAAVSAARRRAHRLRDRGGRSRPRGQRARSTSASRSSGSGSCCSCS